MNTEYSQCYKNCLKGKSGLNIYKEEKNLNILHEINAPFAELLQYQGLILNSLYCPWSLYKLFP